MPVFCCRAAPFSVAQLHVVLEPSQYPLATVAQLHFVVEPTAFPSAWRSPQDQVLALKPSRVETMLRCGRVILPSGKAYVATAPTTDEANEDSNDRRHSAGSPVQGTASLPIAS